MCYLRVDGNTFPPAGNPTSLQSETGPIHSVVYLEPEPITQLLVTVIGSPITAHCVGASQVPPIKSKSGSLNNLFVSNLSAVARSQTYNEH